MIKYHRNKISADTVPMMFEAGYNIEHGKYKSVAIYFPLCYNYT